MASKFEKLIEYIINEDEAKAKALFHQIVVEKSRDIYEGLQSSEMGGERLGRQISGHQNIVDGDEQMEAEDMPGDEFDGEEMGMDDGMGDEFGGDDMEMGGDEFGGDDMEMGGDEGSVEDRVMDLEDAIDELKAEFDALMAGEEGEDHEGIEGEEEFGGDDEGSDLDTDDMGDDEGSDLDTDDMGDDEGEEKFGESASVYEDSRKTPADLMREYVEKVGQDFGKNNPSEGDAIGSGGTKSPINSKSVQINGKNDMGGTTKNIAQGGAASDRDSNTGPKKPSNAYTKGEKKMGQDKYENSPAANTKGYKDKRTVKREQEGQTTDGTVPVAKKSFNPGGKPGMKG